MEKKKPKVLSDIIDKAQKETEWDEYYMKIACLAALRSKDPRTPVGACIVDEKERQIVGIGYNSMPYCKNNDSKFKWDGLNPNEKLAEPDQEPTNKERKKTNKEQKKQYKNRHLNPNLKYPYVVHAAVNAIAQRTRDKLDGCKMYLTLHPDEDCAHAIIMAGIKEVVFCMFTRNDTGPLDPKMEVAAILLETKGIPLIYFDFEIRALNYVSELIHRIGKAKELQTKTGNEPEQPSQDAISWETFFMRIALLSKTRPGEYDTQPDKAVGACIVSPHKQVVAIGFSGYPEGISPEEIKEKFKARYDREIRKEELQDCIRHAEYKAILGGPSVRDCTLYVTKYPCHECAKVVVQAGITKVVYFEGGTTDTYKLSKDTLTTCLGAQNISDCEFSIILIMSRTQHT